MQNSGIIPSENKLIAYRVHDASDGSFPPIVPAPADRLWMDGETRGWANRCLPLRIANQAGWHLLNITAFEAAWTGNRGLEGIRFLTPQPRYVKSMFGYGILTWEIPILFRTPPGFNLLTKGPANQFKDGIAALEGIVETDWLAATFTMNWRFTRPRAAVRFEAGEAFAQLIPLRRGEIERFEPELRNIESVPEQLQAYRAWYASRANKVRETVNQKREDARVQGHYIRGEDLLGARHHEHQNRIEVRPFEEQEAPLKSPPATPPARTTWWQRLLAR